ALERCLMAYETFTWCPRTDPQGTSTFKVLSAQLGDGFAQDVGDGINNETRSWPLQFVGRDSQIKPIRDFLRRHAGYRRFLWTPPLETEPGLFVALEFRVTPMGGKAYTLSATFEQRFAP